MNIGIDVGSTTLKCVVINDKNEIIYKKYDRHYSEISSKLSQMLKDIIKKFNIKNKISICISGSAGMGIAKDLDIPFIQEVYATRVAVKNFNPETDVVIELGGEDAKILFLKDHMEVRMNGSCAGGTGAFIDQMSTLLHITPQEMNELSKKHSQIYTVASRCGVFAKSDIQPLLNQGASKEDISASIFSAVVNQTIAGLAQGRKIEGNILYLGGPLTFFSELRKTFDSTFNKKGICPDNSLYYVAIGAALSSQNKDYNLSYLVDEIQSYSSNEIYKYCNPLFKNKDEYEKFKKRHNKSISNSDICKNNSDVFIGIDAGSTTVKAVVIDQNENIIFSDYLPSGGNCLEIIRNFLIRVYKNFNNIKIRGCAVTGYGEELVKNAFSLDFSIVETMAHFIAAKKFQPNVDFIIDIGGQDIKCFKIKNNTIDNLFLNEACSSGCGSFLQTFAGALGYNIEDFAQTGLFADKPVDLGSRCTVFMNSSVKQAQKDGASIENISAGLSISVVKNAIYKVIRAINPEDLGDNIVVQGGTFLNDAVLKAFETEIGKEVVRPNIAGLMGAFGAALYAKSKSINKSTILTLQELENFTHNTKTLTCNGCSNHCHLTINIFDNNKKFIGGNRCEKPIVGKKTNNRYNLYEYKRSLLKSYKPKPGIRGKIGIPMGLNFFELLPFWFAFFTELGFEVITSPESSRDLYLEGQYTIPSDTICFPAKLMHGHIESLIKNGIKTIFYPCLSYNFNEKLGDNHYNCPVVAYYPEVIEANVSDIKNIKFIYDYLGIHRKKDFTHKILKLMREYFGDISKNEIKKAVDAAYLEYNNYMAKIKEKGKEYLKISKDKNMPVIVLAGRPYHLDNEVNHGIDNLICDLGAIVISEDVISDRKEKLNVDVLNQWTYHARLYSAAQYICGQNDKFLNLVQLVSFGCGIDAITTDEVRRILENNNKIYTQIKIDEITNLGAVKIRLRSLFATLNQ